ncbi:YeiH family putative sulfate export transporter [Paludibacterium denitrificans]|uniref:YeiH family putative sulfate export transporter n=1 Tax=Paludibacterium denitrificans TaxID=2675226 RepID=A0A844GHK6_9NEIS|nr:YeiH family putative sulfate export transporter [Paludibacterium denitrificans]MTD34144.1 YeiH family putative sulfate export transporter [Paludibacterium denitrificans]
MRKFVEIVPGILLAGALAGAGIGLAATPIMQQWGLSALILAILLGMLIGNTLYPRMAMVCHGGVSLSKQTLLRAGIILYGFRLTFQDIGQVGWSAVLIDALVLSSTFALAFQVGRKWLKLDEQTVILVGAGSSICGAAAVLATEPVLKARTEHVSVAVATVVVFGTVSMFLYPLGFHLLQLLGLPLPGMQRYGIFAGSTIHEVAQVVAAARAISEQAANTAVITKMIRVIMLAPFLLWLSAWLARRRPQHTSQRSAITVPWFALWFLLMTGVNSLHLLPVTLTQNLLMLDNMLLATAMAALGLTTQVSAIRAAGPKPLWLATILFGWLLLGGSLINALIGQALTHFA